MPTDSVARHKDWLIDIRNRQSFPTLHKKLTHIRLSRLLVFVSLRSRKSFHNIYYKRLHISGYLRDDAALSEKLVISSSTPIPQKFTQTSCAQKLQSIGYTFVADADIKVNPVTQSPLWEPQRTMYARRVVRKSHCDMSLAFTVMVIQGHWCQQNLKTGCCNAMYNNVDLISKMYEDMATGKL